MGSFAHTPTKRGSLLTRLELLFAEAARHHDRLEFSYANGIWNLKVVRGDSNAIFMSSGHSIPEIADDALQHLRMDRHE